MAWRLSRYQTFVANTTVITAAFLNAVQDAIVDLFNGNYTVKKFQADGTGDAAVDGTLAAGDIMAKCFRADGDGDDGAAIKTQTKNTTGCKCLWQILCSGVMYARIYSVDAGLVITFNVVWNTSTSKFQAEDGSAPSVALVITANGLAWQFKAIGASPWTSFDDAGSFFGVGNLQAYGTKSSTTKGSGQAVSLGEIWKDTAIVAWGSFNSDGTLVRGANIGDCVKDSTGLYTITPYNAPTTMAPIACAGGFPVAYGVHINAYQSGATIKVEISNPSAALADCPFTLIVMGGG